MPQYCCPTGNQEYNFRHWNLVEGRWNHKYSRSTCDRTPKIRERQLPPFRFPINIQKCMSNDKAKIGRVSVFRRRRKGNSHFSYHETRKKKVFNPYILLLIYWIHVTAIAISWMMKKFLKQPNSYGGTVLQTPWMKQKLYQIWQSFTQNQFFFNHRRLFGLRLSNWNLDCGGKHSLLTKVLEL